MPYADKDKQRAWQREWIKKRRLEFFADKKCAVCGSTDSLDLDHIDPRQKASHRIWSWSRERREEEIKKCQILCERHHQEKTNRDNGFGVVHGTQHGYSYYRCRCRPCTDAAVRAVNERRWKRGARVKRSEVPEW